MKITVKANPALLIKSNFLVIPIAPETGPLKRNSGAKPFALIDQLSRVELNEIDKLLNRQLSSELKRIDHKPSAGSRFDIRAIGNANTILTIRLSCISEDAFDAHGLSLDQWRKLGGDAVRAAQQQKVSELTISLRSLSSSAAIRAAQAIAEGASLSLYSFTKYKKKNVSQVLERLVLCVKGGVEKEIERNLENTACIVDAVCLARNLVNTAPSDLTPPELATAAREITKKAKRRPRVQIFDEPKLKKMGAELILAVGRGSDVPSRMIHMQLPGKGKRSSTKQIVLIGKGVTYDSGGLCLKTRTGLEDMKLDMGGAAAVLGVMQAVSRFAKNAALEHTLHVIVASAENMINGSSMKPGDVVTGIGKKSVEILNTDAEGRLVLADALAYAQRLKPDLIIDIATLTGACVVALGPEYAGVFSNSRKLREDLQECGSEAGERFWPLPLAEEYRGLLESPVANLKNSSTAGGPGAIFGALFLKEFVPPGVPWAHLDIAGTAFTHKGGEYWERGATGFGVRTLIRLLQKLNKKFPTY